MFPDHLRLLARRSAPPGRSAATGFSLLEVLVAMTISLLGALAIMQIYVGSEASKRTISSLGEAQSAGRVALYSLEREIQRAGMGFSHAFALGCILWSNPATRVNNRPLQPASIIPSGAPRNDISNLWNIPPGDAESDMLATATGNSNVISEGVPLKAELRTGENTLSLSNATGIVSGDYLLIAERDKSCTLTRVATTPTSGGEMTIANTGGVDYSADAFVFHLGSRPEFTVFAVRGGALTRCDFLEADCSDTSKTADITVWVPIANDVVALRAQYGVDTATSFSPGSKVVDVYCKSRVGAGDSCPDPDTGLAAPGMNSGSTSQAGRACDWARIPVLQMALVTRSGNREKEMVSPEKIKLWPDSTHSPDTTGPEWTVSDRHYRYLVARGAAVLRNILWMKGSASPSC